jgi:hypothetical protein
MSHSTHHNGNLPTPPKKALDVIVGIGVGFGVYFTESVLYFCVGVFVGFLGGV